MNSFSFEQTENQCFYFFPEVEGLGEGDYIGAFVGDVCVGSKECMFAAGNGYVDVPAMGANEEHPDYAQAGDNITFKVYIGGDDAVHDIDIFSVTKQGIAVGSWPWVANAIYTVSDYAVVDNGNGIPPIADDDEWYAISVNGEFFVFKGHIEQWHRATFLGE